MPPPRSVRGRGDVAAAADENDKIEDADEENEEEENEDVGEEIEDGAAEAVLSRFKLIKLCASSYPKLNIQSTASLDLGGTIAHQGGTYRDGFRSASEK